MSLSASKPRSISCADDSVRTNSPATTSRVSAPEIWPTTSRRRRRWRSPPSELVQPPSCRAARASALDARHAGQSPMTMPVRTAAPSENSEHAEIERRVESQRQVGAEIEPREVGGAHPLPDGVPGAAAEGRQQQTLGHHLPHQPSAARAERRAHRHLALACGRAHEQQVRDVHAREQQHEPGERHAEQADERHRLADGSHRQRPRPRLRHDGGDDALIARRDIRWRAPASGRRSTPARPRQLTPGRSRAMTCIGRALRFRYSQRWRRG